MATEVIMPALEMSQEQGVLVRWFKSEGEFVARGEPLMEIETDKAVMEIEASASGVLSNVTAQEGDEIPVGQGIAWLLSEGEAAPSPAAGAPGKQRPSTRPATARRARGTKTGTRTRSRRGRVRASPRARKMARKLGIDLATVTGSGPKGAILPRDLEAHEAASKRDAAAELEYRVIPIQGTRRSIRPPHERQLPECPPHFSLPLAGRDRPASHDDSATPSHALSTESGGRCAHEAPPAQRPSGGGGDPRVQGGSSWGRRLSGRRSRGSGSAERGAEGNRTDPDRTGGSGPIDPESGGSSLTR